MRMHRWAPPWENRLEAKTKSGTIPGRQGVDLFLAGKESISMQPLTILFPMGYFRFQETEPSGDEDIRGGEIYWKDRGAEWRINDSAPPRSDLAPL